MADLVQLQSKMAEIVAEIFKAGEQAGEQKAREAIMSLLGQGGGQKAGPKPALNRTRRPYSLRELERKEKPVLSGVLTPDRKRRRRYGNMTLAIQKVEAGVSRHRPGQTIRTKDFERLVSPMSSGTAYRVIRQWQKDGRIEFIGRGLYRLTQTPQGQPQA